MAKEGDPPPMKVTGTIVGVDFAKPGDSDETTIVIAAMTPHGKIHAILNRHTASRPGEEITKEAWEDAIKKYAEAHNVPHLSSRDSSADVDPDGVAGAEEPSLEAEGVERGEGDQK